jgi:Bax protein
MTNRIRSIFRSLIILTVLSWAIPAQSQDVIVFASIEEVIEWLQKENFWGEDRHDDQLAVPRVVLMGINPRWRTAVEELPVSHKKEIFYRAMLPLILHANSMVLDRREGLLRLQESLKSGDGIAIDDLEKVRSGAVLLRVLDEKAAATLVPTDENFASVIDELLYKVDIIPTGLALGQAAYESGYGASRFAVEGNALFGQWTYGGKGLVPEQQRKSLGDHRIAAFDWPFDSVRGYYINLMSHPAYEDFRRLRAETRAAGRPLKSMELADGLIKYSERGQEYVDTLKGIMRANGLDSADNAVFRDEPMRFSIGADGETAAEALRRDFEAMRASGEMAEIVARMRLE